MPKLTKILKMVKLLLNKKMSLSKGFSEVIKKYLIDPLTNAFQVNDLHQVTQPRV